MGDGSDEARLRRLIEVGRGLVAELDLETVLQRVLEAARDLTDAEYAALGVLDPERRELERFLTLGIDEETHRAIGDLPRGRGVLGALISDPVPLRLGDVGRHPASYGFPPGHPPMRTFLGAPIVVRGEPYGNLYLTEKRGGTFDEADEEALVVLADWAAIAIANAGAYSGTEQRRTELERAVATFEATTEIARAVAGETDLDRVLELIVKRGRALTQARAAIVLLARGSELEVRAMAGDLDESLLGERIELDNTVAGEVLRTGRPERLADASHRLRFALAEQTGAQTGLVVPLVFRGRRLGVLSAFDRLVDGPGFTAWDEHVLTAFALSAAFAVATAQDVAAGTLQRRIEAQEEERRRWARELHDETLQELAALKLLAAVARRSDDADERSAALEQIGERIGVAVGALRALITDLRPAALDEMGLPAALEALVERAAQVHDVAVDLRVELRGQAGAPVRLSPQVEDTIYRVVQEALSNVVKHAAASSVEVAVTRTLSAVEVAVRDDGVGFDAGGDWSGFGLVGIRERAGLVGGTVEIESRPGAGTTVHIGVPVADATVVEQRAAAGPA
ncbi:MAG: GAF domain-containing protein [Pseudomonadota bacterium]